MPRPWDLGSYQLGRRFPGIALVAVERPSSATTVRGLREGDRGTVREPR
ncbi:MAG: hypothetical protein MZV65_01150 [Chromatiales bacterium]|nr:hypothetical protein [Chromatiales bacterium]